MAPDVKQDGAAVGSTEWLHLRAIQTHAQTAEARLHVILTDARGVLTDSEMEGVSAARQLMDSLRHRLASFTSEPHTLR